MQRDDSFIPTGCQYVGKESDSADPADGPGVQYPALLARPHVSLRHGCDVA